MRFSSPTSAAASAVIEALRSGAADVGSIGEAPVPIAVDSGVTDLVTIGLQANPGTSGGYYLVARPNSGITTIEQLRGKRVAYPPGSGRHMITAALLKQHGLDLKTDVQPVELAGTEVVPTFAAGAVEAAIVLGNQYYQLDEPPILGDGTGINTGIQTLIVRRDILDDPVKAAAIGDYVGRAVAANNWKDTHAERGSTRTTSTSRASPSIRARSSTRRTAWRRTTRSTRSPQRCSNRSPVDCSRREPSSHTST